MFIGIHSRISCRGLGSAALCFRGSGGGTIGTIRKKHIPTF